MLIRQWSGQRSLNYMVSEKMKNQRCKFHYYVELVDTLRMNSGYDEELTMSADNAFHTGIALT